MFDIKRLVKKGDYVYAVVPDHPRATRNGYVLEHRVVVENHLGRLLERNEIVHHKDENKKNNSIDNLEVMDYREHSKMHSSVGRTMIELECVQCGCKFLREKRQVKGKGLCSRSCNAKWNRFNSSWKGKQKL